MPKNHSDPFFSEAQAETVANTLLGLGLYALILSLVLFPLTCIHFFPRSNLFHQSQAWKAQCVAMRRFVMARVVVSWPGSSSSSSSAAVSQSDKAIGAARRSTTARDAVGGSGGASTTLEGVTSPFLDQNETRAVMVDRRSRWSWDLRGNRGMILLFACLFFYDFLACWVWTDKVPIAGKYHLDAKRYIANRAGNLCYAHLPIVMLLISRANLISRLTGTSLQDLTWFHRWVGLLTFALGFVHIFVYFFIYSLNPANNWGYLRIHITRFYFVMGLVAAFSFLMIVLLSTKWVRTNYHEVFLCSHVFFSIVCFVACVLHWQPRAIFPLSTIVIYFSSRLLRYATLISNHVIAPVRARLAARQRSFQTKDAFSSLYSAIGAAEAAVDVLDERCLRVSIEVPKGVTWEAGQYMHLCFPAKGLGWGQWHPFTIASIPEPIPSRPSPPSSPPSETSSLLSSSAAGLPRFSCAPSSIETSSFPLLAAKQTTSESLTNTLVFILTPYSSLTARLYQHAATMPLEQPFRTAVCVEGPYGVPARTTLEGSETVVLVAGGTGIAFVSAVWEHVLALPRNARPKKVVVLWTVREEHHLAWGRLPFLVARTLDGAADLTLTTHFHFTQVQEPDRVVSRPASRLVDVPIALDDGKSHRRRPSSTSIAASAPPYPSSYLIAKPGRPDVAQVVREASNRAEGRVQIYVCGPASLSDAVVDAAAECCDPDRVRKGDDGGDIRVEVELFD